MQYCLFIFFDVTSINQLHERLMKNFHYIQKILSYICNLCMHIRNTKDTEPFSSVSICFHLWLYNLYSYIQNGHPIFRWSVHFCHTQRHSPHVWYIIFFASSIVTRSISILICAFISSLSASFLAFSASLRAFSAFRAVISSCIT